MIRPASPRRLRPLKLLLVLAMAMLSLGGFSRADDETAGEKTPKQKIVFAPEIEAKITEFLDKAKAAKLKLWNARMNKDIDAIVQATGLDADGATKLHASADQVSKTCTDAWVVKVEEGLRENSGNSPEQMSRMIKMMIAQVDAYVKSDWYGEDNVPPFDHPAWGESLQHILSAEQLAAWQKLEAARKAEFEKKFRDVLNRGADGMRQQFQRQMAMEVSDIKMMLTLPDERVAELKKLANKASDQSTDAWMKRADKTLYYTNEDVQKQFLKSGRGFYVGTTKKEAPGQQPAWKEGLAKFLSADETKKLEAVREEHKSRRVHSMALMMLALLDDKVAFSQHQREQLLPIAERLVKDRSALFPGNESGYFAYSLSEFYAAGIAAKDGELQPILDAAQLKHWRDAGEESKTMSENNGMNRGVSLWDPSKQLEDVECGFSDYFYKKSLNERKRVLEKCLLGAEDAVRIAGLSPELDARLHTAARGEAEESLSRWKSFIEQNVRSQIQDATSQNLRQRLLAMESYYYSRRDDGSNQTGVWDRIIKTELTSEQRSAWQKEVEARHVFLQEAINEVIMAEVDRDSLISMEQWKKIEPKVAAIIKEYGDDIVRFGFSEETKWFLQGYSMFMPIAGIPEKEMKGILSKEQWDCLAGTQEYANGMSNWENVKQNHDQRNR